MGTFAGHLLPGTFFAVFAIWWSFMTALSYVQEKNNKKHKNRKNMLRIKNGSTMTCICCPYPLQRLPLESFVKLIFTTIGILGEVITGISIHDKPSIDLSPFGPLAPQAPMDESMPHMHSRRNADVPQLPQVKMSSWHFEGVNAQHTTMYAAFGFGAIVEILLHYKFNLPKNLDMFCGMMAFSVEALLFGFHLHGRDQIDVQLHVLLEITILMCIFCCILEYINQNNILFTYGRIIFVMLQGTWFWEIGFILYPPFDSLANIWEPNNHQHLMFIVMSYAWHFLLISGSLCVQLLVVNKYYSNRRLDLSVENKLLAVNDDYNSNNEANGLRETRLSIDSDDDSEVEFDNTKLIRSNSNTKPGDRKR
jgi:hypothetical protein